MLKRKFRKLVNNPKLFFSDMAIKHSDKISYLKPKKMEGSHQYTVVSAVYNVGRYLDDYFNSLVKQRLDFKKHITLILVDDGSTDNSAEIIKRWQQKYPNNIRYIYKENGGQASARNLGIEHVTTEWVTFIDPDDTLDREYFSSAEEFIASNANKKLSLVITNIIFYFEKDKIYKDTHPLKYRFSDGNKLVNLSSLNKNIQLSASTAIFKKSYIDKCNVRFDDRIKPNFEDAHFVALYMSNLDNHANIGYVASSKYIYRKRDDGSSTLDTSWEKASLYNEVLELGCLGVINEFKKSHAQIPVYVQRTILYHLIWYIKRLVNHSDKVAFLDDMQKDKFKFLLQEILSNIDDKTILDFELAGCWFYHKVGLLACFKNRSTPHQIAYIEQVDERKNLIEIVYYSHGVESEKIKLNSSLSYPAYTKNVRHDFLNDEFLNERRVWVRYENINSVIEFDISNKATRLSLGGRQHKGGVLVSDILKHFNLLKPNFNIISDKYQNAWLLMDRDTQADDNAEHLYKYIQSNIPEEKIYFVLSKKSHDWERLKNLNFNLIEFGSEEHEQALMGCDKVISSHADKYVTNYLGPKMLQGRHFVFLQHGVTKDDISGWMNQEESIDCFITASAAEYNSIHSDGSRYKYTKKNVVLTGFPRHDTLLSRRTETERLVVIMPTWRSNIVGNVSGTGNSRQLNPDFMKTKFATHWYDFIHSEKLKELSEKYNFKVAFFPHANIQPYLDQFETPSYISIYNHQNGSIQDIFSKAAFMITDYSSVAFEMAVQNKPTIYYQFDEDELFTGGHFYSKGYFEYRRDGFGPVVINHDDLILEVENLFSNDGKPSNETQDIINSTFPNRDGLASKRVYQAIKALNEPLDEQFIDINIVQQYASASLKKRDWSLAEKYYSDLVNKFHSHDVAHKVNLSTALRMQGKLSSALKIMEEIDSNLDLVLHERALIYIHLHKWEQALLYLTSTTIKTDLIILSIAQCLSELSLSVDISFYIKKYSETIGQHQDLLSYWFAMSIADYNKAISLLDKVLHQKQREYTINYQIELLIAKACRENGDYQRAHNYLASFEKHTKNLPKCREEIATLAYERRQWDKVFKQIQLAYPSFDDVPEPIAGLLIRAHQEQANEIACSIKSVIMPETILFKVRGLREKGRIGLAYELMLEHKSSLEKYKDKDAVFIEHARIEMYNHNWQSAISYWDRIQTHNSETGMARLRCLAELKHHKAIKRTLIDAEWVKTLPNAQKTFAEALYQYAKGMLIETISSLQAAVLFYTPSALVVHKPHLWLSRCYRESGQLPAAHAQLVEYEKIIKDDPLCREQIARLAMAKGDMPKVISQLEKAYPVISDLPHQLATIFVVALYQTKQYKRAGEVSEMLPHDVNVQIENYIERFKREFA
ncbi:CDP-glycerol glycerophosphotransferase family protein [Aeromonas hydrophila]|uniref:CDP-glycerol glycerophosphotransferase family protein n=1 Tax=Aeromonas hydrophila TaxID=644 RepID=UPI003EC4F365